MGQYEIGLVQFYDASAKEIIGPFDDSSAAHRECRSKNDTLGVTLPGHGKWGWMVARWGEIPRAKDCVVRELVQQ